MARGARGKSGHTVPKKAWRSAGPDSVVPLDYPVLVARVREMVEQYVPQGASVAVISHGDQDLITFNNRHGMHLPHDQAGEWIGYNPETQAAIACLEEARARGARYFLVPQPYLWWLDHYKELALHLRDTYRQVASEEAGALFDLTARTLSEQLSQLNVRVDYLLGMSAPLSAFLAQQSAATAVVNGNAGPQEQEGSLMPLDSATQDPVDEPNPSAEMQALAEQVEALATRLGEAEGQLDERLETQRAEHAEQLAEQQRHFDILLEERQNAFEARLTEQETRLSGHFKHLLAEQQTAFEARLAEQEARLSGHFEHLLAEQQTAFEARLAEQETRLTGQFEQLMEAQRDAFEARLTEFETQLTQTLGQQHEQRLQEAIQQAVAASEAQQNARMEAIEAINLELSETAARQAGALEAISQVTPAQPEPQFEAFEHRLSDLESRQADTVAAIDEIRSALENVAPQVEEIQSRLEQDIAAIVENAQTAAAEFQAGVEAMTARVDEIDMRRSELAMLLNTFAKATDKMLRAHEAALQVAAKSHAKHAQALAEDLEDMEKKLEELDNAARAKWTDVSDLIRSTAMQSSSHGTRLNHMTDNLELWLSEVTTLATSAIDRIHKQEKRIDQLLGIPPAATAPAPAQQLSASASTLAAQAAMHRRT